MNEKRQERKKHRNRKIIILLIWGVFLFLILTTSTYAWFTVNRIVSINSLDVKINVEGGLQISTDGESWGANLSSENIIDANKKYTNSANQLPTNLVPVSTGGNIDPNTHYLEMYYGEIKALSMNTYYTLASTRSLETESNGLYSDGQFIAFDVFIKQERNDTLYLTNASGSSILDGQTDTGIENAIRFAFVVEGVSSENASASTLRNLNNATDDDVYIWEPNYDTHTINGVSHALNMYGITTTQTNASRISYDGIIDEFGYNQNVNVDLASSINYPQYFKTVDVDVATPSNFTNNIALFDLEPGAYKIRIYIWIEGQDVDCEDNASVGGLSFNIQFTTVDSE